MSNDDISDWEDQITEAADEEMESIDQHTLAGPTVPPHVSIAFYKAIVAVCLERAEGLRLEHGDDQ